ncbi:DUF5318 family protein [Corynebacterium lizhenjunii]|uniref:DUF5318 family protein n=1 Tax=Corynebacterium lizhenjunii TaxID=2709394 RepID=A0A7T0KE25_9CORY|nr:DUF5318 family protein [Corynebacterium lizhenjunii]QPK79071.1 DUF5318 family protein [Corynebacterium lizhenjunii]
MNGGNFPGIRTKHHVSHEWERATALRRLHQGNLRREDVCDADFLLRAAARHHGVDSPRPCPVCQAPARVTLWIFGDALGRRAGSARPPQEVAQIARELAATAGAAAQEFTVHAVEVCPTCRWNHLLETATVY